MPQRDTTRKPKYKLDLSFAKKGEMPTDVQPMLATPAEKPFTKNGWLFEVKWDGYRVIAQIKNSKVNLYSRNQTSFNDKFKSVAAALSTLRFDAVLDGEIVALDKSGKPKFQLLQNYQDGSGKLVYYVFDILYFNGYNLTGVDLLKRKKVLETVLPNFENVQFCEHINKDGELFFDEVAKMGLEGIIAKDVKSRYLIGKRTTSWLKIKIKKRQEVVIGGFTKPRGGREKFGALLLGVWEKDRLNFVGHTGSGFDENSLNFVYSRMEGLTTGSCPFFEKPVVNMPATWVKPELICEVEFTEWTDEGRMRHPIFKGLREDKVSQEVSKEKNIYREGEKAKSEGLSFSHTNKIYFPKDKITKGEVIDYYKQISSYILPYIKDRPHSLYRNPNGIGEKGFYQKDIDFDVPPFVTTIPIFSESEDKVVDYMVCKNTETLLYMANLGCIEINPWLSRVDSIDKPDFMLIDLDPEEIDFSEVVVTALKVEEILKTAKLKSFVKTSGKTGIHIMIPLRAKYDWDVIRQFAQVVATIVRNSLPKTTSIERSPSKRKNRVYIDYLQNRKGQTMAAPYCVRPIDGAPVSNPISWNEVNKKLDPGNFNLKNTIKRLAKTGDMLKGLLDEESDILKAIDRLGAY